MTRTLLTIAALGFAAGPAAAQGIRSAWSHSPNAWSQSPNAVAGWPGAYPPGGFHNPLPVGAPGFGSAFFPYAGGFYGGYGFGYGGYYPSGLFYNGPGPLGAGLVGTNFGPSPYEAPADPVPLQPAGVQTSRFKVALSGELAATLAVDLPAKGEVWVDGVKQKDSGSSYTLTSPALRAGERHKFDVRAEWTANGQRYRAERTVSVSAGDRQKLTLVLGDPVK